MVDTVDNNLKPTATIEHYPPLNGDVVLVDLPVTKVTLLEDRAQVVRKGRVNLAAGRTRLAVADVAPVLQDVSLRGEAEGARVVDTRARRAMRIQREDKPEALAALEEKIDALARTFHDAGEDRGRLEGRRQTLLEMVIRGLHEIPEDAGWGVVAHQTWHDTLEGLFTKSQELDESALELFSRQQDLAEDIKRLVAERSSKDRPDARFGCRLELDVDAEKAGESEVTVEYVVPAALWRPMHRARLLEAEAPGGESTLEVKSLAAVWQNTGEDWNDVELWFSTARSSLGHEPPKLADDLLTARRKNEKVVIARREVKVQRGSLGSGGGGSTPAPAGIELPGVDDGGDVQTLKAPARATLPSDGRPNLIPLFEFKGPAVVERVTTAEIDGKVFIRARAEHTGERPLLAGPVELIRRSGTVGWSKVLFVAPGERFELGFGPDHGLRVTRKVGFSEKIDEIDHWQHKVTAIQLFISNLSGSERTVEVKERIPVSEIEHVRVAVLEEQTAPMPEVDEDGFCTWQVTVPGRGHHRVHLSFRVSTAPGVQPV
jgi:uncharacterized protein (TIGR02231 family)